MRHVMVSFIVCVPRMTSTNLLCASSRNSAYAGRSMPARTSLRTTQASLGRLSASVHVARLECLSLRWLSLSAMQNASMRLTRSMRSFGRFDTFAVSHGVLVPVSCTSGAPDCARTFPGSHDLLLDRYASPMTRSRMSHFPSDSASPHLMLCEMHLSASSLDDGGLLGGTIGAGARSGDAADAPVLFLFRKSPSSSSYSPSPSPSSSYSPSSSSSSSYSSSSNRSRLSASRGSASPDPTLASLLDRLRRSLRSKPTPEPEEVRR
mmetsp:Transcript_3925/g.8840  ORF Transcript_3925/g.8840 Transcript_3925/m.8840 type:complete len:264 (-) Transcript_3925:47-838(-)